MEVVPFPSKFAIIFKTFTSSLFSCFQNFSRSFSIWIFRRVREDGICQNDCILGVLQSVGAGVRLCQGLWTPGSGRRRHENHRHVREALLQAKWPLLTRSHQTTVPHGGLTRQPLTKPSHRTVPPTWALVKQRAPAVSNTSLFQLRQKRLPAKQ